MEIFLSKRLDPLAFADSSAIFRANSLLWIRPDITQRGAGRIINIKELRAGRAKQR